MRKVNNLFRNKLFGKQHGKQYGKQRAETKVASAKSSRHAAVKLSFENKLLGYLLTASLIPTAILMYTFWQFNISVYLSLLTLLLVSGLIGVCAFSLHQKISYQLRSLSNLLTGLNEGDYSMRGSLQVNDSALGELVLQLNTLTETLTKQRFIAHESQLLVTKVIQHIDVAIIAIDQHQHIALLNPAAEQLLSASQQDAIGSPLARYNASELLTIKEEQLVHLSFAPQQGNYQVIRDHYREQGQQHDLYFITNVHGLLRAHERQAWQNLIRVLSHEINNSLSPIASLASTLKTQAIKQQLAPMYSDNLTIISQRSNRLKSFIDSYRQLSSLPEPTTSNVDLSEVINAIPPLFPKRNIVINSGTNVQIFADIAQIEQVLINLVKNADEAISAVEAEAHCSQEKSITVSVSAQNQQAVISIVDQGTGIKNSDNLFTPFYSTKKQGSGIGLVLSRQIIEAHGGFLIVKNREKELGCAVEIRLPLH